MHPAIADTTAAIVERSRSLRAEYLYVDLGRQNLTGGGEFTAPGVDAYNATVNTDTTANVVRLGVNYRF